MSRTLFTEQPASVGQEENSSGSYGGFEKLWKIR
jgi:hypothetical protein